MSKEEYKIEEVDMDKISDFPNHPFKVELNDEIIQMSESVKEHGVLVPVLIRPKGDGNFEMVSGYRRKLANKLVGNKTIPSIIRNMTDDETVILIVDSNIQKENVLPSKKAFAYKMKLNAIKHQGKRVEKNVENKKNDSIVEQIVSDTVTKLNEKN